MRSLALLALAALAGCAGSRPSAPDAASVVAPDAWRNSVHHGADGNADWWQSFGDPVLTRTIEVALANNVDIALAAARVEEARGHFQLVNGYSLPSIAVGVAERRERFLNAFGQPTYQTAGRGELAVAYDLDLFGRLRHSTEAARAALLATAAAQDNVRLAVASSAATGYIGLCALDARLLVLQDTLSARDGALAIARRRMESGYATRLELEQAEAEYRATQQQIPAVRLAIARQEHALTLLLASHPRDVERGLALSGLMTPSTPDVLPSLLLRRRPDIAQAEQQIVAADASLDAARAAFMPTFSLAATGGFVDSTLIRDPVSIFSLGGSILAPLFQGGRLRAQVDVATARRDQAVFAYRKAALVAFREVEDALASLTQASDQERAVQLQRDALMRALTQASNRYRAGYSSYLEQLDAQRGLLSAELTLIQARADRLTAAVSLFHALGGGWSR